MLQATARRVNRQTAPVVSLQLLKQLDAASLRRYGSTSSSTSTSCALLQQPRGRAAFRHGSLIHAHGSSGIPLSLLQSRFQSTEARPSSGGATAVPPPPPPYTSDKAKRAAGASLQPDSSSEKATAAKVSASLDGAESAAALGAASKEKSGTVASTASTTAKDKKEVGKPKERLTTRVWKKIKHEANHYWNGTKLLGKEIKISARLQYKLLQGKSLTRREKRQLKRTTQDLLRLIPFIPFLVIPFMELLLPVALKIFPNMLPSTFEDKHAADEKKRKLLKVRIEMAKFLQETIRESGLANDPEKIKQSEEFRTFFRKVRSTGEQPSTDDIVKVARLFQDDLTLDNLSRPQLVSMCRYMNINAFGTDNFLRYTIRSRMAKLEKDDKLIQTEGVDSLSATELAHACASRGIRTSSANSPEEKQRAELGQWIDLHLKHNLSGTLLILSKAFAFTEKPDGTIDHLSSLKHTLSSLPDTLLNETELGMLSDEEDKAFKQRLEVLQEQEELIEDEAEQEQEEEEARKMRKQQQEEAEEAARAAAAESGAAQTSAATPEGNPVAPGLSEVEVEREKFEAEREQAKQMLPDEMAAQTDTATATLAGDAPASAAKKDAKMTTEQLTELGEALSILSARSSVRRERQDLAKLMEESLGTAAAASAGETSASAAVGEAGQAKEEQPQKEDTVVTKLEKRIQKMITQIDEQLDAYDKEVYDKLQHFDCADGKISVLNLRSAFEQIRHRPDDETITALIDKLDVDHDGFVPLEDVTSLAEVEGLGVVIDDAADQIVGETEELRKTEGITDLLGSAASSLSSKLKGSETAESKKEEKPASTPKKPKREEIVE